MPWQKNVSEGLYRTALVLGFVFGLLAFLLAFQNGVGTAIITGLAVFGVIVIFVAIVNFIIRRFTG